ncbi:hypothetical protein [Frigidibacter sp. ROC022]|uniref:hypothetical protein n=1 Tax=Frigidibacter sp. ROC022 TaxID=2971796 RepID=UPI00215A2EAA|nr:hypothetical protein [Frigidibacter sp. ROC022]MCR8724788.1 hypothetical protein [Frigidibacter sp. ROC022]
MDITVGSLRVNLSALALYHTDDNPELSRFIARHNLARRVYRWNCTSQSGVPSPPGARLRLEAEVLITVTDEDGIGDPGPSANYANEIIQAAGLSGMPALVRAFNSALPPLEVPIEYADLLDPYKADYSLDILARITYLQCLARPYGLLARDTFYILVPHLVTFHSVVTGRCGGTEPAGRAITGWSPHVEPGAVLGPLERQIMQEEAEAEARRRRLVGQLPKPSEDGAATPGGSGHALPDGHKPDGD